MSDDRSKGIEWARVGSTALIGVAGIVFTIVNAREQHANRASEFRTQLMTQREESETGVRHQMFDVLTGGMLGAQQDDPRPVEEQVRYLELFLHNFHNVFNGRALFDLMEIRVTSPASRERLGDKKVDELLEELRSLGMFIARQQLAVIRANGEIAHPYHLREDVAAGDPQKVCLGFHDQEEEEKESNEDSTEDQRVVFKEVDLVSNEGRQEVPSETEEHCHDDAEKSHVLWIRLNKLVEDGAKVSLWIDPAPDDSHWTPDAPGSLKPQEFTVDYYDAPFSDNTLLPDGHRFAITLLDEVNFDEQTASFAVVEFPAHFVTVGYRPSLHELQSLNGHLQDEASEETDHDARDHHK